MSVVTQIAVITNACMIAFTSNFIERTYYTLHEDTMEEDYISWAFAKFPAQDDVGETCLYKGFINSNGQYTLMHWKLLAIKLGFVIAFENLVFGLVRFIELVVPDIPTSLYVKIKREKFFQLSV